MNFKIFLFKKVLFKRKDIDSTNNFKHFLVRKFRDIYHIHFSKICYKKFGILSIPREIQWFFEWKIMYRIIFAEFRILYQSPIKMCNAHFNCDTMIGTRRIFAMFPLSSRKCNAGTALKTDWNEYFNRFSVSNPTRRRSQRNEVRYRRSSVLQQRVRNGSLREICSLRLCRSHLQIDFL